MTRLFIFSCFLLTALLAGCSALDTAPGEGESDDPNVLLRDAEAALQRNEPALAVDYLRRAADLQPLDTPLGINVRIRLSTALLETAGVDALTLQQMVRPFAEIPSAPQAGSADKVFGTLQATKGCKFKEKPGLAFDPFDPTDVSNDARDYYDLLGSDAPGDANLRQQAVQEAQDLVVRVFNLNETTTSGRFACDPETLDENIALLQSFGISNEAIAEALVNQAVVQTTLALVDIVNLNGVQTTDDLEFFYVYPDGGTGAATKTAAAPPYVSVCLPDVPTCEAATVSVQEDLDDLSCAALLLDRRATLLDAQAGSVAREVADLAADAQVELAIGLNAACNEVTF